MFAVSRTVIRQALQDLIHEGLIKRRKGCLLYTSDAADERSSVDLGGRRIIKKKKQKKKIYIKIKKKTKKT